MQDKPKISIISPSKNSGKFIIDTIESIMSQTYKNWEHIVVDGESTDETLDMLRQYPHIRRISEKDNGIDEAFLKGLAMSKGEYIMWCCITDGYIDKNWFKRCVEKLDDNPEISLVWGIDQNMLEDGTLHKIVTNAWFDNPPPSGPEYIYYWLKTGHLFHERDMCVRKKVLEECFPKKVNQEQGGYMFCFNFNRFGYLPHLIPVVAAYGRQHSNTASERQTIEGETKKRVKEYLREFENYKKKLKNEEIEHKYRDGAGKLLPYKFDVKRCLNLENENKLKKICSYFVPPLFQWFGNKLLARYRVYKNIKKIRRNQVKNYADNK